MNENEMTRLAAMGNALRPDWPTKSLHTFIERHLASRAYRDAVIALGWVCTTDTETPRLLLEAGPWWRATATDDTRTYRPPRKAEECLLHAGQYRDACHGCVADRLTATTTAPGDPRRPDRTQHLALARAQLAQVKANTCGHGVNRSRAVCKVCTDTDTENHEPAAAGEEQEA